MDIERYCPAPRQRTSRRTQGLRLYRLLGISAVRDELIGHVETDDIYFILLPELFNPGNGLCCPVDLPMCIGRRIEKIVVDPTDEEILAGPIKRMDP